VKTQNRSLERLKNTEKEGVKELGWQWTNFFYDMNAEGWGWNRKDGESRYRHLKRMHNAHFTKEDNNNDVAFSDLNPYGLMKLNEKIGTDSNTYYFSITTGFKDNQYTKPRDVFQLP
jgi:hypothetical protein